MLENEGNVQLTIAFEFIAYPRWTAVNIFALAWHGLKEALSAFGAAFKAWRKGTGAQNSGLLPAIDGTPVTALRVYSYLSNYACAL